MLLLAACSDYDVEKTGPGAGFDTGDSGFSVPVDSDTAETETADTDTTVPECPTKSFEAEPLTVDETCVGGVAVGSFTPTVEWSVSSFTESPTSNMVMAMPIIVSLTDDNGDGKADDSDVPDVIFTTYVGTSWSSAGVLRALSGDDGHELWSVAGSGLGGSAGLAAADLDDDGFPEIIGTSEMSTLIAFNADGTERWTSDRFFASATSSAAPAIADMDGDGSPEIVVGSSVFDEDGDLLMSVNGVNGSGNAYGATSFPADLDEDGVMEVVAGGAVYSLDGSAWFEGSDGNPAVADFDLDGVPEIVKAANGSVFVLELDGSERWKVTATGSTTGPPTIADYDGDGYPEIGVAGLSTYTVFDGDGTILWQNAKTDGSSGVTGSAVFDFEGDGIAEAVYADELAVHAFSGPDGTSKFSSSEHSSWTVIEYAPIVDVDGDGEAEIVVPNCQHPSYSTVYTGITVLGDADHSWRPGRKIWNQHAFHLTNVEDDGSIPTSPEPSWRSYNNFRSGDTSPVEGTEAANLKVRILDTCTDECAAGRLEVWISVGSSGLVTVNRDVVVRAEVETALGWTTLSDTTVAGPFSTGAWGEGVAITLEGLPDDTLTALRVTIDPDGDVGECHEDDNVAELRDTLCP